MGLITGSFESEERAEAIITLPNIMTATRAIGGVVLGVMLARGKVGPETAALAAGFLAATDAEGTVINAAKPYPEIKDTLRIWPSKIGRMTDVIADKIYVGGVLGGGLVSGTVPKASGAAILATEVVTAGTTFYTAKKTGEEPRVSKIGKLGMISRVAAISSYFAAEAVPSRRVSGVLENVGHLSSAAAVGLGVLSCVDIARQSRNANSEEMTALNPKGLHDGF